MYGTYTYSHQKQQGPPWLVASFGMVVQVHSSWPQAEANVQLVGGVPKPHSDDCPVIKEMHSTSTNIQFIICNNIEVKTLFDVQNIGII